MEKIWLKSYPENIPAEINPDRYSSLIDVFNQTCSTHKEKTAWLNKGCSLSYADWHRLSRDFAAYLQKDLCLKKGDRLAIMLPNCLQYPVVLFGALLAGMVVVNVNPRYTEPELEHQLNDSGAQAIIVLANFNKVLQATVARTSIKYVIITEFADLFPFPKSFAINFFLKYIQFKVPSWRSVQGVQKKCFKQALARGKKLEWMPIDLQGSDTALLQYTGGSTGVAKGAVLTHRNLLANMEQAHYWIASVLRPGEETFVTPLPLYHIFSLMANMFVFMREGGCNLLITDPRDIAGFIKELKSVRFSILTGVNTLFNALINHPDFAQLDFSSLRLALSGGMATQHAVAERWQQVTGKVLLEAYGLTETSPAVAVNPMNLSAYNGSVGLPLPSTDIKICDDEGHEVALGEAGELWVQGPQVMLEYWHASAETKQALTADGWFKTGDIATIDAAGFVRIVDRKKDMIIVSGFNVYPNQIEDVLTAHPDVLEAAVVGCPDEQTGEAVCAYIVPKSPHLTEAALLEYCRQHLTEYKLPKHFIFRDSLPKSNVGKILRRVLRDEVRGGISTAPSPAR